MNFLIEGHTAIVTGATSGIGKAIAIELAKHGTYVAVLGTNPERGNQVVEEIRNLPKSAGADFYSLDVSNFSEVDLTIKKILEKRGQVDILINNAGITRDNLLMKMSEEDWNRVLEVNLNSCFNTCRSLVRTFIKARKGKIINISSVIGLTGNAGQVNYAASKSAIIGMTKALAKELASRNVLVNCIAPGFIETSMTETMTEPQKNAILSSIPLGRMGTPKEVANLALFLASPLSDYITGQVITIDGGMVM